MGWFQRIRDRHRAMKELERREMEHFDRTALVNDPGTDVGSISLLNPKENVMPNFIKLTEYEYGLPDKPEAMSQEEYEREIHKLDCPIIAKGPGHPIIIDAADIKRVEHYYSPCGHHGAEIVWREEFKSGLNVFESVDEVHELIQKGSKGCSLKKE